MQTIKSGRDIKGAIVRCPRKSCRQVMARLDVREYRSLTQLSPYPVYCTKCHAWAEPDPIYGRYVAEVVCSSKCTGAVGASCDCSCGGENHGGKFGVAA